jgi:hypothetical protein
MRRVLALIAALVLVIVVTSPAVGSGPTSRVNQFVGHFDMVDWDMSTFVGRVDVRFTETTDARPVPGTLEVHWAAGNPIRWSEAELQGTAFGQSAYGDTFATEAYAQGVICDHYRDGGVACRDFAVMFQVRNVEDSPHVVGWGAPGFEGDSMWYPAGTGAFVLVYAGPTDM